MQPSKECRIALVLHARHVRHGAVEPIGMRHSIDAALRNGLQMCQRQVSVDHRRRDSRWPYASQVRQRGIPGEQLQHVDGVFQRLKTALRSADLIHGADGLEQCQIAVGGAELRFRER